MRKPILGELLAPLVGLIFWKFAMHCAVSGVDHGDQALKAFYRPFSGLSGSWAFMRVQRWGKPAKVLADVPGFLPKLKMLTLIFHGSHGVAIPRAFALRASALMPSASMVTLESGHFIPLHRPEPVAAGLAVFFNLHASLSVKAAGA